MKHNLTSDQLLAKHVPLLFVFVVSRERKLDSSTAQVNPTVASGSERKSDAVSGVWVGPPKKQRGKTH